MRPEGPLTHVRVHPELNAADLRLIRGLSPRPKRLLDLGAGRGDFVQAARRDGLDAWALDMEQAAGSIWRRSGVPGVLADAIMAPFPDQSFDLVRMKELIEHVTDPLALVREARRLLIPGGRLIAHVPSPYSQLYPAGNFWDDYTHVRPFSRLGLRRLLEDGGMRVVQTDSYVLGRNRVERAAAKVLALLLPHTYRVIGQRL